MKVNYLSCADYASIEKPITHDRFVEKDTILSRLVHTGVAYFAQRTLDESDALFTLMQNKAALARSLELPPRDFTELVEHIQKHPSALNLPPALKRLSQDYKLNLADLFVLALCAEAEHSYWLNLALLALQSPDKNARPSLHLLGHLSEELFGTSLAPQNMIQHALVREGLLRIEGDEPLPLRKIAVDIDLWEILHNSRHSLHGVQPLHVQDSVLLPKRLGQIMPKLGQQMREKKAQCIAFRGGESNARLAAVELASQCGLTAVLISPQHWQQNPQLKFASRYANWLPVIPLQLGPADCFDLHDRTADDACAKVFVAGKEGSINLDGLIEIEIPETDLHQRLQLWAGFLNNKDLAEELAHSALLDGPAIKSIADIVKADASREGRSVSKFDIANLRSRQGGSQLRQLAQPLRRYVDKDALILPAAIAQQFEALIQRCSKRESLWQGLGASAQSSANYGVRALFCGDSGTGKTLSASFLAGTLGAPLYRLDLASVMNKYIGETEKNLGLLLDQAAASDTILLLDEADALFGKRTEGDSAGDRFANMLTNYLLTRIESHPGIVILTSNNQSRIDSAFTRRLDVVIEFPCPNVKERHLIWRAHLGERAPDENTCHLLASYCDLPGGFIRNAVLNAAACEKETSGALSLPLLLNALKDEYRKLGRAVPPSFEKLRDHHV